MEWLKWYVGASTDPKMAVVARRSGQSVAAVVAVWAMLLERAGTAEDAGNIVGFDCEGADVVLGLEDGAACAILEAMRAKDMLDGDRVAHWEERQKKNETAAVAERKQLQREREKLAAELARLEALREEWAALSHAVPSVAPLSQPVTEGHGLSQDVTEGHGLSRKVTGGHGLSADVTLRGDKIREDIKNIYTASAAPDAGHAPVFFAGEGEKGEAAPPSPSRGPSPPAKPEGYRTRRGRLLSGKRLESFLRFWSAFGYQRGKAEAADAWLDIPELTDALAARICAAARQEAEGRETLIAKGHTPKMAQGWLAGRRWEDYEPARETPERVEEGERPLRALYDDGRPVEGPPTPEEIAANRERMRAMRRKLQAQGLIGRGEAEPPPGKARTA